MISDYEEDTSSTITPTIPSIHYYINLLRLTLIVFYLLATFFALLSRWSVGLEGLAKHGKGKLFDAERMAEMENNATTNNNKKKNNCFKRASSLQLIYERICDLLTFQLPKKYFKHFYFLGVFSTISTPIIISFLTNISDLKNLNFQTISYTSRNFIDNNNVGIPLFMCFFHVSRRLYESLFITKFGSSTMSFAAYFLGMIYYLILPFALLDFGGSFDFHFFIVHDDGVSKSCQSFDISLSSFSIKVFNVLSFLGGKHQLYLPFLAFFTFNVLQCITHINLSQLRSIETGDVCKKRNEEIKLSNSYHLTTTKTRILKPSTKKPTINKYSHPGRKYKLFKYVVCPHYTFEILLYISFVIFCVNLEDATTFHTSSGYYPRCTFEEYTCTGIPKIVDTIFFYAERIPFNSVRFSLLLFVGTNLAVSAKSSHEWYLNMFLDEEKRLNRWILFPGIY